MIYIAVIIVCASALSFCIACSSRRIGPNDWQFWAFMLPMIGAYIADFFFRWRP